MNKNYVIYFPIGIFAALSCHSAVITYFSSFQLSTSYSWILIIISFFPPISLMLYVFRKEYIKFQENEHAKLKHEEEMQQCTIVPRETLSYGKETSLTKTLGLKVFSALIVVSSIGCTLYMMLYGISGMYHKFTPVAFHNSVLEVRIKGSECLSIKPGFDACSVFVDSKDWGSPTINIPKETLDKIDVSEIVLKLKVTYMGKSVVGYRAKL
ncbi:hypothetical protein ACWJJH_03250 [Endozoicomonadaceae bacterium StTr2]